MNEAILESFRLDPIGDDIYHIDQLYESLDPLCEYDVIKEATTGATKQSIFTRIINAIKRFFAWIGSGLKWIWNRAKSIFAKDVKTADQIYREVGGTTAKSSSKDADIIASASAKSGSSKKVSAVDTAMSGAQKQSMQHKKTMITIPSNPKSEIKMEDEIPVELKDMFVEFDRDKKTIIIQIKDVFTPADNSLKNVGKSAPRPIRSMIFFVGLRNQKIHNALVSLGDLLKSLNPNNQDMTIQTKFVDEFNKFIQLADSIQTKITEDDLNAIFLTMEEIEKLQAFIDDMNELFAHFDASMFHVTGKTDPSNNNQLSRNGIISPMFLNSMNTFAAYIMELSFAINQITYNMSHIYEIDLRYMGSCDDPDRIAKMAEEMVKHHFPTKYIMRNIYIVANRSIRGERANELSPIWGQTRVVMFPDNPDIVYKFAYNTLGYRSNRNEIYISNFFKGTDLSKYLAGITWNSKNAYGVAAERVNSKTNFNDGQVENVVNKLNNYIKQKNAHFIITDVHSANVGVRGNGSNGEPVVIDYGLTDLG